MTRRGTGLRNGMATCHRGTICERGAVRWSGDRKATGRSDAANGPGEMEVPGAHSDWVAMTSDPSSAGPAIPPV